MYRRNNEKILDIDEMNKLLKYVSSRYIMIKGEKARLSDFKRYAYYTDSLVNFKITFKKGNKVCTYKCRKDGERKLQSIIGGDAFRICKQYVGKNDKFDLRNNPHIDLWEKILCWSDKDDKFLIGAKAILYSNPKYEGQRVRAYSYDLNSSYSNGMLQDMPDTSVNPRIRDKIKNKNELGFYIENKELICTEEIGKFCDFIFPKVESPFKKFVEVWYKRKKEAQSGTKEKQKAKDVLNFSVGYYQKVNPFIRARIISYANKLISDLMDENTILCNTDSIVSLVPRKDLNIGENIGQFKEENKGTLFAYKGYEYQWDLQVPTYRHVSKKWFPKGWDILKDKIPNTGNLVKFNPDTGLLEEEK